jgi:hypothetical protein
VCVPLFDPEAQLDVLKRRVADYPEALRRAMVQDFLFMAEFTLTAFAPKVAVRSEAYGTAACLTRAVNELVLALFALNRKYLINDKTALAEIAEFERAPREFGSRVQKTLGHLGASSGELVAAVESVVQLVRETIELTDGLYQPRYPLPKGVNAARTFKQLGTREELGIVNEGPRVRRHSCRRGNELGQREHFHRQTEWVPVAWSGGAAAPRRI